MYGGKAGSRQSAAGERLILVVSSDSTHNPSLVVVLFILICAYRPVCLKVNPSRRAIDARSHSVTQACSRTTRVSLSPELPQFWHVIDIHEIFRVIMGLALLVYIKFEGP